MGLWQTPTSIRMAPARTGGYVARASYMTVMAEPTLVVAQQHRASVS